MHSSKITLLLLIGCFILTGCSAVKYNSEVDPQADFSQYETYRLSPWNADNAQHIQPQVRKRIEAAVDTQLQARGFRRVETHADLFVHLVVLIEKKHGEVATADYYHSGGIGYNRPFGYGSGVQEVKTYDYEVGTLVIDLFDQTRESLIWQGTAEAELTGEYARHPKTLDRLVKRIFKRLPI